MTVRVRGRRFMLDLRHRWNDGRVERIRLAVPDNMQTRRAAERYERMVRADLARGIDPRKPKEEPKQPPKKLPPTLAAFVQDYLAFCASPAASARGPNKQSTLDEKSQQLNVYLLPEFGKRRLDTITTRDVDTFCSKLATYLGRATICNIMGTLRHLLRVARRWNLVDKLPEIQTNKGKPDRLERDAFFGFDEAKNLIAHADDEHRTLILIGIRTGLRTGELRALRPCDLDLDDGWLQVRRALNKRGQVTSPKNGKPRSVELAWDAAEALAALPLSGDLVFPGPDGNHFAVNALQRAVKRACVTADLTNEDGSPKRLGGHALRHTWASHGMMRGIPAKVLMEYGGWSSLAMLERYAHLAPRDMRGEMDKLAPRRPSSGDGGDDAAHDADDGDNDGHTLGTTRRPKR